MFYKVSNNVKLNTIESEIGLKFRFPDLYESVPIIDGLNEELLPVITSSDSHEIDFAIWGILPQGFREHWSDFQKIRNTLNIDARTIDIHSDYLKVLKSRRCAIIVSGFFASYNYLGQLYPIYMYPKQKKTLMLAGIYNITHDGFITCSLLLEKSNYYMSKLHNISDSMPIILDNHHKDIWLGEQYDAIINGFNDSFEGFEFSAHTIAKEFYKNNILYSSVLEPAIYENLIINS